MILHYNSNGQLQVKQKRRNLYRSLPTGKKKFPKWDKKQKGKNKRKKRQIYTVYY